MKKIIIALLIAAFLIFLYHVDFVGILDNLSVIKKEEKIKDCHILVGGKVISLGTSEEDILKVFGTPCDTITSEYGFVWNIYHQNFQNYLQIGLKDGFVVGIYTNSPDLSFKSIEIGEDKDLAREMLGEPLGGIIKGDTKYLANGSKGSEEFDIYKISGGYVTLFYDIHKNNLLTSVNIIDCDVEEAFDMLYAPKSDTLAQSFAKQSFYLTNAIRVRENLAPFKNSNELDALALYHAQDMAKNEYFNHKSQNGDTVLDRAQRHNIKFKAIGENLAMGAQNTIYMHELLMNSSGHRENILGDFSYMGVGISFSENDAPYLTQNFMK